MNVTERAQLGRLNDTKGPVVLTHVGDLVSRRGHGLFNLTIRLKRTVFWHHNYT